MERTFRTPSTEHFYRNNEIASGTIDAPPAPDSTFSPTTHSSLESAPSDKDVIPSERERMLEQFMQDIKSFIRGIDVNNL